MRLDEAEKSVRVFLIATAADPQAKVLVGYRNDPAPILGDRFVRLKPLVSEIVPQELSQTFSPEARVDLLLLAIIRGESIRAKLNYGRYSVRAFVSISFLIPTRKSSTLCAPWSPCLRLRTDTLPCSASRSPTTSM